MTRPACLRTLAWMFLAGLSGATGPVRAEQSDPAAPTQQADPNAAPTATTTSTATNAGKKAPVRLQANAFAEAPQTPAQQKYGLPQNPILGGPVNTDLTKPLTLDHAIQIGLAWQNSIAISKSAVDVANAQLTEARSSYFPQVAPTYSFQAGLTPSKIYAVDPITGLPTSRLANRSLPSEDHSDAITAKLLLYDTGQREATVGARRRNVFAAQYGLGNSRQDVILGVTIDYYNLLRDRDLVKVQNDTVQRAQTIRDVIDAQVTVGAAAKSDVYQADADLANTKVVLLGYENDVNVGQATLKNAMGIVKSEPVILPDASSPPPPATADPVSLEKYVLLAYQNRLDIKRQQEVIYSQGYSVKLARIQNGVTVDATITEGYVGDPVSGEERLFSVNITYPLFDAGNTRAAIRENKAVLEQQRRTLDQLQQNVRLDVAQSYLTREQARARVIAAQIAVDAGNQNYNVALAKQQNQLVNIPEVVNAQVQLNNAEVSRVEAVYDYYVADAMLQRSIGINDPVFVPKVPGAKPPVTTP